jgi:hypothetical protein
VKYLLDCPECHSKIPVQAGQAGQRVQCNCGQYLEVPSIRRLHELETVADEERPQTQWTARQGMLFLGTAMIVVAAAAAGAILVIRPGVPNASAFSLKIDRDAIQKEVNSLSPAQAYVRMEAVMTFIPGYSEQLGQGSMEAYLLPCLALLKTFEDKGPEPLAPGATEQLAKDAVKRASEIGAREDTRRAMNDWLWLIGILAVAGVLLTGASFVLRGAPPVRRPIVGNR